MPPINVAGLRHEWETMKAELKGLPPDRVPGLDRLDQTWQALRISAQTQNRTVFAVSSLMAISTLSHVPANLIWLSKATRAAALRNGGIVGGAVLDYYSTALEEISRTGFPGYWKREFRPYLRAAAAQFAPEHGSLTERLFRVSAASGAPTAKVAREP
jgi:hypothetical protein